MVQPATAPGVIERLHVSGPRYAKTWKRTAGPSTRGGSGWFVVRAVAMVFDCYLQGDRSDNRYSRIV